MSNWMMEAVLNSPKGCYELARQTGRRMPGLESTIMEDPRCACLYAINVIKGRWLEAEGIILKYGLMGDYRRNLNV